MKVESIVAARPKKDYRPIMVRVIACTEKADWYRIHIHESFEVIQDSTPGWEGWYELLQDRIDFDKGKIIKIRGIMKQDARVI